MGISCTTPLVCMDINTLVFNYDDEWREWEHVFKSINFSKSEFRHLFALFR
jgi:hypothetical protein